MARAVFKNDMQIYITLLVFGLLGCSTGKQVAMTDFPNPCSRYEISGRGVAELKGDLNEVIDTARANAIDDLLRANLMELVSTESELRSHAVSRSNHESFTRELRKRTKAKVYPMILYGKKFNEQVVGDKVVSWICVDKDKFQQGVREAVEYRHKRFEIATEIYKRGMDAKRKDPDSAIQLWGEAKETLEDIGAENEYYRDEDGKGAILYKQLEKEIGMAVERKEHEYIESKKQEIKKDKITTQDIAEGAVKGAGAGMFGFFFLSLFAFIL